MPSGDLNHSFGPEIDLRSERFDLLDYVLIRFFISNGYRGWPMSPDLVDKLVSLAMGTECSRPIGGAKMGDDIERVATD